MIQRLMWFLVAQGFAYLVARDATAQQRADPDFDAKVASPAYTAKGPRVLLDEAHKNFHTAAGRYKPFVDLIRNDGFEVIASKASFTAESLAQGDVLIIANALGSTKADDPAFTPAECDAVRDWVKGGGSLLLIADHYPFGHAAALLAKRFDVGMGKGFTEEYDFSVGSGLAPSHPIIKGRSEHEGIRKIRTFTGQSIRGPQGSVSLMSLPAGAQEMVPDAVNPEDRAKAKRGPSVHPDQGVAFLFGKGRVVVLGEAAMLSAQLSGENDSKFGMNQPGIDNRQFALNLMHWLSGLLPPQ